MKLSGSTYVAVSSPIHACDARVKTALLFAFTICVFFATTWAGLAIFIVTLGAVMLASRVPLRRYFGILIPIYVLMGFSVLFNMFAWASDASDVLVAWGSVAVVADGLQRGVFLALRMLLLSLGSMVVCFTSTSTELTAAFGWILRPLRVLRVPVDDVTTVFSIALRFIPLLAVEGERIRDARLARGAGFDGSLADRLRAWGGVFVPVFVGLFRRADRLADAMDARCYGLAASRTSLARARVTPVSVATLVIGLALCVGVAVFL